MADGGRCDKISDYRKVEMAEYRNIHASESVSYTHLRAHETRHDLVCRLLLEKKKHEQAAGCRGNLKAEKIIPITSKGVMNSGGRWEMRQNIGLSQSRNGGIPKHPRIRITKCKNGENIEISEYRTDKHALKQAICMICMIYSRFMM